MKNIKVGEIIWNWVRNSKEFDDVLKEMILKFKESNLEKFFSFKYHIGDESFEIMIKKIKQFYGVMAITLDSESKDSSSNLDRTACSLTS